MRLAGRFFDILRPALAVGLVAPRRSETQPVQRRADVLRAIEAQPGVPIQQIAKQLSLPLGTVRHYIERLEKDGLIRTLRAGRRRIAFASSAGVDEYPEDRAFLQEESSLRIVAVILARQPCGIMDIVEASGLSQRVVYYHAKRLLEAGLITRSSTSHYHGLRATARLFALLGP